MCSAGDPTDDVSSKLQPQDGVPQTADGETVEGWNGKPGQKRMGLGSTGQQQSMGHLELQLLPSKVSPGAPKVPGSLLGCQ